MITKDEIRKINKKKRENIGINQKKLLDNRIFERLIASSIYKESNELYIYLSVGFEVDTYSIIKKAMADGKKVAVPKVISKNEMVFSYYDHNVDLIRSRFGILEPEIIDLADNNGLLIVPMLAFDRKKNRVGYGGGYYDRYISSHKNRSIGLCYSFLEEEHICVNKYDMTLDMIITDEEVI